MKKGLIAIFALLLINTAFSLQIEYSPTMVHLCGNYAQYTTIYANTTNELNSSVSLTAKLFFDSDPGINFVTSQSRSLSLGPFEKKATSWTVQCSSPNQGTYQTYLNFTGSLNQTEQLSQIIVHEATFSGNLTINSDAVSEQTPIVIGDSTPLINVRTTRDSVCKGSLDVDEQYPSMDFIFYGSEKQHDYTFPEPISNGLHKVYVRCMDAYNYVMPDSLVVSFIVDTMSPKIILESPQLIVVGENADLKVSVDEESTCRYDRSDKSYESMSSFGLKTGNIFTHRLYDLEERAYDYYIKCKDKVGNIGALKASFEVQIPPEAEITYERESPLPKGTFQITLKPSKELRETPTLYYTFTDDNEFRRNVNLEKVGDGYVGYIIIDDQLIPRSGEFKFKGIDLQGNSGEKITKGATFLVDTIKPNAPTDIQITAINGAVELNWYYEGESLQNFNIYRSTSNGVGHTDIYETTAKKDFKDTDVLNNQIYYYRIAAVDKAGNVGSFSNEVSVYAKSSQEAANTQASQIPSNPPTKETKEWKDRTAKDIETILIDLSWAQKNLLDLSSKESAIDELSLQKKVTEATKEVEKLKLQINEIDLVRMSDVELREFLSVADALIARTKKTTPQNIELLKTTDFVQATSESDVETAAKELISNMKQNISESDMQFYFRQMKKLNDKARVEGFIKTLKVSFIDGRIENRVLVKKEFNFDGETLNTYAYEIIPKTVAGDISSLDIRTPDYFVVNEDPVISWYFGTIGFEKKSFSYIILANDDSESAKTAKTIFLLEPQKQVSPLTGFTVHLSDINGFETIGVIFGIIIVLGLGMYYMTIVNEIDLTTYFKKNNQSGNVKKVDQKIGKTSELKVSNALLEPKNYFVLRNGDVLRNLEEFKQALSQMDDFTFYYHAHADVNDFADWIEKNYGPDYAAKIRNMVSKEEMIKILD